MSHLNLTHTKAKILLRFDSLALQWGYSNVNLSEKVQVATDICSHINQNVNLTRTSERF